MSLGFILTGLISSRLFLCFPSTIFLSGFTTDILFAFLSAHARYMTRSSHPPWFDHPDI
jgi:hypothetical protein